MTAWDAFVSCLASDFSDQAWDDHACIQADELLASFRDEEWAALIGNWQRQPDQQEAVKTRRDMPTDRNLGIP